MDGRSRKRRRSSRWKEFAFSRGELDVMGVASAANARGRAMEMELFMGHDEKTAGEMPLRTSFHAFLDGEWEARLNASGQAGTMALLEPQDGVLHVALPIQRLDAVRRARTFDSSFNLLCA
jgi:hypothetical protein